MNALNLPTLLLCLLLGFSAVAAGQTQSADDDSQGAQASGPESAESDDQDVDRGFDPCLLNPGLAVCADRQ
jgi:hypothetical protein